MAEACPGIGAARGNLPGSRCREHGRQAVAVAVVDLGRRAGVARHHEFVAGGQEGYPRSARDFDRGHTERSDCGHARERDALAAMDNDLAGAEIFSRPDARGAPTDFTAQDHAWFAVDPTRSLITTVSAPTGRTAPVVMRSAFAGPDRMLAGAARPGGCRRCADARSPSPGRSAPRAANPSMAEFAKGGRSRGATDVVADNAQSGLLQCRLTPRHAPMQGKGLEDASTRFIDRQRTVAACFKPCPFARECLEVRGRVEIDPVFTDLTGKRDFACPDLHPATHLTPRPERSACAADSRSATAIEGETAVDAGLRHARPAQS